MLLAGRNETSRRVAEVLMVELVARLLKEVWRNNQREVLRKAEYPGQESALHYTTKFLNKFIPFVQPLTHLSSWKDRNVAKTRNGLSQAAWCVCRVVLLLLCCCLLVVVGCCNLPNKRLCLFSL